MITQVEVQLSAIFTRLQEIVTLVNITKQGSKDDVVGSTDSTDVLLEDYKSVVLPQNGSAVAAGSPLLEKLEQATNGGGGQALRVAAQTFSKDYSLKDKPPALQPPLSSSRKSVGSSRDGLISITDYSPPEKRCKPSSTSSLTSAEDIISSAAAAVAHTPTPPQPQRKTSKGGKGIRNRVFCGDCPGCLKNDDCGQCRYCRDKTKFGGLNRLRQKCLHRRCQMDTHRRSNAAAAAAQQAAAATSPRVSVTAAALAAAAVEPAIYSGVELARLASQEAEERQAQYSTIIGNGQYGYKPSCQKWSYQLHWYKNELIK